MNYHCKRATELLSESMHRPLSRYERIGLGLHMLICTACRRFRRQVELIRRVLREMETQRERTSGKRMPNETRERIASALQRHAQS